MMDDDDRSWVMVLVTFAVQSGFAAVKAAVKEANEAVKAEKAEKVEKVQAECTHTRARAQTLAHKHTCARLHGL